MMTDVTVLTPPPDKVTGRASVGLPPGMTADEAERLVREADEAQARKENG